MAEQKPHAGPADDWRRRAGKTLEESERCYRELFENASSAIFQSTPDGQVLMVNPEFARMFGYESSEQLVATVRDIDADLFADPQRRAEIIRLKAEHPDWNEFENLYRRQDGSTFLGKLHVRSVMDSDGRLLYFEGFIENISDRQQAEAQRELEAVRLQVQLQLHNLMDAPTDQLFDFMLEGITRTTRSPFAFIGLLDPAEAVLTIHAWSQEAMARCALETKPTHFPIAAAGLWGECVRQRQPVIVNAYAAVPVKKGYPAGHVPIERFLAVPIFDGEKIVAVAAAANQADDYTDADSTALTILTNSLWNILRRQQTEEALRGYTHTLRERVKELGCLYAISELVRRAGPSQSEVLQESLSLLASAYQFPEIAAGRITWGEHECRTENWRPTPWSQSQTIRVYGEQVGTIEVCYLEERPAEAEGPFLAEERQLLHAVADLWGQSAEHQQAQEAHRESEARYRAVTELISDYAFAVRVEPGGRMVREWGAGDLDRIIDSRLDGADVLAEWLTLVHPADLPAFRQQVGLLLRNQTAAFEFRIIAKSGKVRWLHAHVQPEWDEAQGRVVRICGALRDITAHKQVAEMQQRGAEQYRSILQTTLDGFLVIDLQGRFIDVNDAYCQLVGYSRDEMLGMVLRDVEVLETESDTHQRMQRVVENGADRFETKHRHKDGRIVDLEISVNYLPGEARMFVFLRDITARQRAEEQLQRTAAELARSNRDLERFASVAAHDLQEPLRTVVSYAQLLADSYRGRLEPSAAEIVAFIVDGAGRMQELVQALLSYARIDTRGQEFAPTDCEAVLQRTLTSLRQTITESGATITHDPLPTASADVALVGQLFQNLIVNAIKFHRPEEPLRVHIGAVLTPTPLPPAPALTLPASGEGTRERGGAAGAALSPLRPAPPFTGEQGGAAWLFSVRDNGIGIAPRHHEEIFGVFRRLHTREEYPGTGIGLAVCAKIVEHHGGRIWVESEPGQGATFCFTLPVEQEVAP